MRKYHPAAFRKMLDDKRKEMHTTTTANMERGIGEDSYREDLNIPMMLHDTYRPFRYGL